VLPALLWLIVSTVLLTLPGSALPKDDWLGKIWFDKWVHVGLFTLLVFLWCWSLLRYQMDIPGLKKGFIVIALLAFAYGVGMEFIQKYFVMNRSFDTGDILADAGGCIVGLMFSRRKYIKK